MRLRLDLHVHTRHSLDCRTSVEAIIQKCVANGLDGFAITDHDTLRGVSEAQEKRGSLVLVPGLEVSARGAHILALGVSKPIPAGLSMAETVELVHEQDAVAVIAHPYFFLKLFLNVRAVAEAHFDAVEVANASNIPFNWTCRRSAALAQRLMLPQTGGSDAHIPDTVGRAYTFVESESRDVEDIIQSIKKGCTDAQGTGISLLERFKKFL